MFYKVYLILIFFLFYTNINYSNASDVKSYNKKQQNISIEDSFIKHDYKKIINIYKKSKNKSAFSDKEILLIGISFRKLNQYEQSVVLFKKLESKSNQEIDNLKRTFKKSMILNYKFHNFQKSKSDINTIINKINQKNKLLQNNKEIETIILRNKLEKATACYQNEDYQCAENTIDELIKILTNKNDKIIKNPQMLRNLRVMRFKIYEKKKIDDKIFSGSIGLLGGHDSNPNFSSGLNNLLIYGLEFQMQGEPDSVLNQNTTLKYKVKLNKNLSIYGAGNSSYMAYNDLKERDSMFSSFKQGIDLKRNNHKLSIPIYYYNLNFDRNVIFGSDPLFLEASGISPSYNFKLNRITSFILNYKSLNKQYKNISDRDSDMNIADMRFDFKIGKNASLFLNYGIGSEIARNSIYTNDINFYSLGFNKIFKFAPLNLGLIYSNIDLDYRNINQNLSITASREDSFSNIILSLSYFLKPNFSIDFKYIRSVNNSNVEMYQFTRNQYLLGFNFLF